MEIEKVVEDWGGREREERPVDWIARDSWFNLTFHVVYCVR